MSVITVERKVLEKNDEIAGLLRKEFAKHQILVLNLLSSPGSGKTTLLERTLEHLQSRIRTAVIEGDVQTDHDARRIARYDVPVVQIVTNGSCHLDAQLVRDAVTNITLENIQLLFIENVGNLVCPASFDLGEKHKVVIVSTTEGDDKPVKYPYMFRASDVCILNKIDLLEYVEFDTDQFIKNAESINPDLRFFKLSAKTGDGLEGWYEWLEEHIH